MKVSHSRRRRRSCQCTLKPVWYAYYYTLVCFVRFNNWEKRMSWFMNIVVVSLVDKSMTFEKKRWSLHSWSVLPLPTSEKKAIYSLLSPLANMCTKYYYCYPNCIVEFLSWAVLLPSPRLAKKVISVLSTFFRSQLDGFCYYLLLQFHRSSSSTWSTRIIYPQMALFRLPPPIPKRMVYRKDIHPAGSK